MTKKYLVTIAVALILLLAWTLRLYRLDAQSLQYEEGYAVYIAGLAPTETLLWSSRDLLPPLHSYLLAGWLPLVGRSEFSVRFLSVAAGTLTVAVLARLGRKHSRLAGLVAGCLAAVSPFYVWHSQYARMYALLALFGSAATLVLVEALRRPEQSKLWIAFALLETLALYTHTTSGFLLLLHLLAVAIASIWTESPTLLKRGGAAIGAASLAWLPWVLCALPFFGENAGYWPGHLDWRQVVAGSFRAFVGGQMMGTEEASVALVLWGLGCLFGLGVLLFYRRWGQAFFLLAWAALPIVSMSILFRDIPKFQPYYLILASPPIILLPASGVDTVLRRPGAYRFLAILAIAALVTLAGVGLHNLYFDAGFGGADFRTAAQLVQEQMIPGETVVLVPGYAFPVWQYYFDSEGWLPLPDDPILDVRNVLHYPGVAPRLNEWLGDHSGVWLVQWDPHVIDPTAVVPYVLEQMGEEVPLSGQSPNGIDLRHYRIEDELMPLPADPAVHPPQSQMLTLPLGLIGCDVDMVGEGIDVACYWQAEGDLPDPLAVSARLFDESGTLLAWSDGPIAAGRWPGGPVLARHLLPRATDLPAGPYWLSLAVYDYDGFEYGVALVGPLALPEKVERE